MKISTIYRSLFSLFFILIPGLLIAQDYQGAIHLVGREFRESGDTLYLSFDITIDSKSVPNCGTMIFEPEIATDEHTVVFPFIQVNGKTRSNLERRWFNMVSDSWLALYEAPNIIVNTHKYTSEQMTYSVHVPYEPWMEEARFTLKQELAGCRAESRMYTYSLFSQLETAPKEPYAVNALVAVTNPVAEVKLRNREGSAFLDFQVGKSVILSDFRRNPTELAKIHQAVDEVMDDPDISIRGMGVHGYASPEGSYKSNDKLAYNRALALKDYLRSRYGFADNMMTVAHTPEDWEGLATLVEQSTIDYKDDLLAIIRSSEEPDARERRLKTIGRSVPYNKLLREVYPDLRRVEYRIDYAVRGYNLAEAREVIKKNPEHLSQLEMVQVATSYGEDSPEYKQIIMELIPRYYPDDPIANNNAAALMIRNNELNTARRLLEKAPEVPAAWNNLGVIYLLQDEYDNAEPLLQRASAAGVTEAEQNLKELTAKREDTQKREKKLRR